MTRALRSLDQILSLADDGQYLPELLGKIEANNVEMRQFANDFSADAKSKLTITIDMKLDRFGQMQLTIEDKLVGPKPPKRKAVAWVNGEGGVTAQNPAQSRMEIRDTQYGREFATSGFAERSQPKEA